MAVEVWEPGNHKHMFTNNMADRERRKRSPLKSKSKSRSRSRSPVQRVQIKAVDREKVV